jgi:hypothetical protein
MEQTILRSQVFQELQKNEPFDMVWITADRRRGTGGEIISAEGWMIVSKETMEGEKNRKRMNKRNALNTEKKDSKDPDHVTNGTVNVFNPANSGIHPHKVHYDLIQFFNGRRVIN